MANSFVLNHNEVAEIEKALEENNLEFNDIVNMCSINRKFVLDYYNNYNQNDPEDKQTIQSFLILVVISIQTEMKFFLEVLWTSR